jgi:hypothetical protein
MPTPRQNPAINSGGPFQQYDTGPGLVAPQQTGMTGVDQTQPGLGEDFAAASLDYYGNGGMPALSNNQQSYYDSFQASRPDIAADPGLDPYFDNAVTNAQRDIDKNAAARGSYGSSAAIGFGAQAATDLRAQQAHEEAQYNLQRLGEQRQWEGLGFNMAGGADANSLAASEDERAWLGAQGSLAFAGQDASRARGQDFFNNTMALGDRTAGIMGQEYDNMFTDDAALMEAAMAAEMGTATEAQMNALAMAGREADKSKAQEDFAMGVMETGLAPATGYAGAYAKAAGTRDGSG